MITEFKPGTLYRLSPENYNFLAGDNRIFLCTEKMYPPVAEATINPTHLLIDVETGGLWDIGPTPRRYEEYLK